MKSPTFKLAGLFGVIALIGTVAVPARTNNAELSQIAGYRQWTRVSESPRIVLDPASLSGG